MDAIAPGQNRSAKERHVTPGGVTHLLRPEILALTPFISGRAEGAQTEIRTYLDINESPYPPYPAGEGEFGLNRYPEAQPASLRARLAEHIGAAPDQVLLTRGVDEAIDLLIRAFCAAGRDGIIICPPAFALYAICAQIQGAAVHEVPLVRDRGFHVFVDGVVRMQSVHPTVKLVFLCSPGQPTGTLLRRRDVLGLCRALAGRAVVVADQTYVEYSEDLPLNAELAAHDNLIVLRSLSKSYSLAGERIGVTLGHPEVIRILRKVLPPYPLARSAVEAANRAMTPAGVAYAHTNIRRIVSERDRLARALRAMPAAHVFPSDANFLLVRVAQPKLVMRTMYEAGIKIRDRSEIPGIEGCVRVTIGTRDENDAVISAFARYGSMLRETCRRIGVLSHHSAA